MHGTFFSAWIEVVMRSFNISFLRLIDMVIVEIPGDAGVHSIRMCTRFNKSRILHKLDKDRTRQ